MNKRHIEVLSSPRWAAMLERDLLPWVASVTDLGDDVLEVGPGPGLTTELLRVLRPGGALVGSDGYDNEPTREAHAGDQFVPLAPETLPERLGAIGFSDVAVDRGEYDFRFYARKP
jgi:SAM-dependent methyltransferase